MKTQKRSAIVSVFVLFLLLMIVGFSIVSARGTQQALFPLSEEVSNTGPDIIVDAAVEESPSAPCGGGPVIDGITLDECFVHNITVGGNARTITVWYTNNPVTATRMVDGSPVVLSHWVNNDTEPQQVAQWAEEAWLRYYSDSTSAGESHEPYINGCGDNLNIQLEDGVGWGGIAYWASSGNCNIGIDAPTIRSGGGQRTVYHEVQHYLQYDYDSGCYGSWKPNYPDNSEFVEGYADLGSNSVDAAVDAAYQVGSYNPNQSMYKEGYSNLFLHYWTQQLGTLGSPSNPWYHIDPMYDHYEECDDRNSLYVLDTVIPALSGGSLSKEDLFLNFFAANWARNWADAVFQPELVYPDADDNSFSDPPLKQNVAMSGGSNSWSDTTPDDWAAYYYQVTPQTGCPYIQVEVDGSPGADLGINFMAADTSSPTVLRSAWIGEDFTRTFAAAGVHNRVVAIVNSFANNETYDVTFTCVNPALNILEPRQVDFALVGPPEAPIAFLARFSVTSGGTSVRGLPESSFSFDAEGDSISVVPGSFQEVGDEYWVVLNPPVKPAGTTFIDFEVCLDGSICDSETDALLYVDPGNSDIGLVFDASGSMDTEDIAGEGKRYVNAQKAGKVVADLLRDDDRILVMDFSAEDNPLGCGLPGGDGNCPLDMQIYLPRTDVTVPSTITSVKNAINLVNPREWTPIGEALVECKNLLLASPFSLNPKYCFLLSDGEENVNRLYADVKAELVASGVVINTIGLGPEAPGSLLAQIAADTGGDYRPVPTTPGGLRTLEQERQARLDKLAKLDVPEELLAPLGSTLLPGNLGLADVYDDFDTKAQDAARIFHVNHINVANDTWMENSGEVDKSVSTARFVVAGKQIDGELGGSCAGYHRRVEVLPPDPDNPDRPWIPISPVSTGIPLPDGWDVRNGFYEDVLIVTDPTPGTWRIRTKYFFLICQQGQDAQSPADTTGVASDFMMNMSVQSPVHLEGRLLGIQNNQASAGDTVGINGVLLDRNGTITNALITIAVVDKPGSSDLLLLLDDGMHNDGKAGDGIYGADYSLTTVGGSYNVRILTAFPNPNDPNQTLIREWNGGFWVDGPQLEDPDDDGMPSDWEIRCKLDPNLFDAQDDLDDDGLSNIGEFYAGTIPCDPDTDNGGEADGSEVNGGRNPRDPEDDLVRPFGIVNFRPLNGMIRIDWTRPLSYTNVRVYLSTIPDVFQKPVDFFDMGRTGVFTVTNLTNDTTYYLSVIPRNGTAFGPPTEPEAVEPKSDPDPPSGWVLIEDGAPKTTSREVSLEISSSDVPPDGAIQGASAHKTDILSKIFNQVSGDIEMRISNDPTMENVDWEPLAFEKPWTLECSSGEYCYVYAQFRDGAGNESLVVFDEIFFEEFVIYLPNIVR